MKEVKNKIKGICTACRCLSPSYGNGRFCCKHRRRYQKENNPIAYTYDMLKQNAKTRNKVFTLTLEQFKKFCTDTNYIELKGKTGGSASIDRKDPNKGYEFGNLQVLTLSANTSKRWEDAKQIVPEELPF
jgi:hypothetical protein